jgi:ATP-dependent helicase/nuclease subunit B
VSARLAVWNLRVDDMGGMPFARTRAGAFLDLVALAAEKDFAPVALMALLKHPFCRLGLTAIEMRRGAQALELAAFRAPYFGNGLDGIATAIDQAHARSWQHSAVRRMREDDWQAARDLVDRLQSAFAPITAQSASSKPVSVQALAAAHYAAAENLVRTTEAADGSVLRQGEAGEWATQFFASLIDPNLSAPQMPAAEYPDFYRTLVAEKNIRPRTAPHPRLSICDPFEARLQQADLVILGALNEATWPRAADPGPWLNRPMRQTLGLPAPEERIGQSAHDFTSLLAAPRVALTRAAKVDGAPTVPSRWLLRLQALVAGMKLELKSEKPWLAWAQARSAIGNVQPVPAPEPRPLLAARPRKLSVTAIETWIANPYGIFARHILGLDVLPALGAPPSASLRGQIAHEVLGRFAQKYPQALPGDVAGALTAVAQQVFADYTGNPRVAAFWSQRFVRFAQWFAETEGSRRAGMTATLAEVSGKLVLASPGGPFTLTARADRIDVGPRGLVITDYKTAQGVKELATKALDGRSPQLPLEAAIAAGNGFANVPRVPVAQLRYISTSGGEPPGQDIPVGADDVAALAAAALDGLTRLIAVFDKEATPYKAIRRARFQYKYDDYAHLARVAEWSADSGEEE